MTPDETLTRGDAVTQTKSGFEIDGKSYPIPTLDTINLDEERILFIYADTVLQDFMPVHPETPEDERRAYESAQTQKYRNPDFKRALAHIAYRREHPELEDKDIQEAIGKVNALAVDLAIILGGGDESPPAQSSQKQHEKRIESEELTPPSSSGRPTETSSDPADESLEPTGTIDSDTSSLALAQSG